MNKWIVSGAWCVGNNTKSMNAVFPSVHSSQEDAVKEMINLVMDDLEGIKFKVVQDEWGRGFEEYFDEEGNLIATIGPDYAKVDTNDVHGRYLIAEVGF